MNDVHRLLEDAQLRPADRIGPDEMAASGRRPDACLRVLLSRHEPALAPREWGVLVDLVHAAARRLDQIEARAHGQDRSFGEALRHARDEALGAERHAQRAEGLADEARHRAEARIAAAEARADAAEEQARAAALRARQAEDWMGRVQATIRSHFPDPSDQVAA